MKYLFLICVDANTWVVPENFDVQMATEAWVNEMEGRGVRLTGDRVRPSNDATTVQRVDGTLALSDGPFAETKEHIGGFDVIECRDLDEAIEIAAKHPVTHCGGAVEIRPFWID